MDRNFSIVLAAGFILAALGFSFNIYAGAIVAVLAGVLLLSLTIMKDSTDLPDIVAELSDDAKSIVLKNSGNASAHAIHVALVPENIEFDLPALAADATHTYSLGRMLTEVKVVVSFRNSAGDILNRSYRLSATDGNYDPLKPMMPLFGWK